MSVGTFAFIMLLAGCLSLGLHIGIFLGYEHLTVGRCSFHKAFFFLVAPIFVFFAKSIFYLLFDFGVISTLHVLPDAFASAVIFAFAAVAAVASIVIFLLKRPKACLISTIIYYILAVFFDIWTLCWQFQYVVMSA